MRRFELRLGGHLTSGTVELYNSLIRLYSRIKAAIVPSIASGGGLLQKSGAGMSGVVPVSRNTGSEIGVASCIYTGCVPWVVQNAGAELTFSAISEGSVVPGACGYGQIDFSVRGSNVAEVMVQPVQVDTLHISGNAHGVVYAELPCAEAELEKCAGGHPEIVSYCDMCLLQEKNSKGENGITVLAEAEAFVGKYRKLYELDPMTLDEMDGMTLDELDFVVF